MNKIKAAYITNIGKVRSGNEDSILLHNSFLSEYSMAAPETGEFEGEKAIFIVADGMGGHEKGEVASRTVLQIFQDNSAHIDTVEDILNVTKKARDELNDMVRKDNRYHEFGSTVAGMVFIGDRALVFNCGDSRVYRLNAPFLEKLTRDHSIVQNLADNGQITEDEMRTHPRKNVLTSVITGDLKDDMPEVYCREIPVAGGQIFFLCTDGAWECMTIDEMEAYFDSLNVEAAIVKLTQKIMETEARDNFSMILLEKGAS